ncbi:MAG: type II toxin-antitoxin system HipA family toxin [Bacteroidales bacterium]|jgi:serine/threonine-protein kinase HipA|nr:type II toxin-antitoxin system HipA family toxin [Bacteroidales bacterium]
MTTAKVQIWGMTIGYISWENKSRTASFEFEKKFLKSGLDIAPLSMPINKIDSSKIYTVESTSEIDYLTYKGLPHILTDSLPDAFGNSIINAWLATQGRRLESFNPVERLCYTGKRGTGALEYYPAINVVDETSTLVNIERLVKLSEDILSKRKGFNVDLSDEAAIKDIIRVGTSAGGARPKAIIAFNEETKEIRSGQVDAPEGFSHWLLKIDGVRETGLGETEELGRIEYAYFLMAKDCHIEMSDCRLLEEGRRAHFMTRRFDRIGNEKLHMQSLNAISGMNFRFLGTYSYEQVFSVLKRLKLPYRNIDQLYRRMVFNIISRNCDDHSKNISFLMDRNGNWSLAPAYDVCYAYNPTGKFNFQHFLSVNGKYNDIRDNDILEVGAKEGIKNRKEIIEQVKDVASRWPEYSKKVGLSMGKVAMMLKNDKKKDSTAVVKPSNKLKDATDNVKKNSRPGQSPGRNMKL